MKRNIIAFVAVFAVSYAALKYNHVPKQAPVVVAPPVAIAPVTPQIEPSRVPDKISVTTVSKYLKSDEVIAMMKQWNDEAPRLTELGSVGKTSKGTDIPYLRMGTVGKPKVLIHACLHGNEHIATSCTLTIMGHLLSDYGHDKEITDLLDNRDVYFVPMLSIDSYISNDRHVEGVDPNRNYPCPENPNVNSSSPVKAIINFCNQNKFKGVISGHSFGRIYLLPRIGPDQESHRALGKKMAEFSKYDVGPIGGSVPERSPGSRGFEIDWYYWTGSVAILTEFGSGSHRISEGALGPEGERNYKAYVVFIRDCVDIKTNPPEYTGPKYSRIWEE